MSEARMIATRQAYGEALIELGRRDPRLVALDADVAKSISSDKFHHVFPERAFNLGIAEQNMFGFAAGLASTGRVVFASTYAVFASMRACELLGMVMAVIGYVGSGHPLKVGLEALGEIATSKRFRRSLLVLGLLALYFFVLWRNTPFWFSTMLFLCLTMWAFKAGKWWKIILIGAITTGAIIYFFGKLAMVPLPSDPGILKPLYNLVKAIF